MKQLMSSKATVIDAEDLANLANLRCCYCMHNDFIQGKGDDALGLSSKKHDCWF